MQVITTNMKQICVVTVDENINYSQYLNAILTAHLLVPTLPTSGHEDYVQLTTEINCWKTLPTGLNRTLLV